MKPYTFFKHDRVRDIPAFELGEFENDTEARRHALDLLVQHPTYSAVEVSDGLGEPFRVARDAPNRSVGQAA